MNGGDYREYGEGHHGSVGVVTLTPQPGEFQSMHDLSEEYLVVTQLHDQNPWYTAYEIRKKVWHKNDK